MLAFTKVSINNSPSYVEDDLIKRKNLWDLEQKETKELLLKVKQQEQIIGELNPVPDYVDEILARDIFIATYEISEDYGVTIEDFNNILHYLGVFHKQGGQWLLCDKHQSKGYTCSDVYYSLGTNAKMILDIKWTIKGSLFLYNLLKKNGILPIIEKEKEV